MRHCRKENKMLKQLWDYIFLVRQALPAMIITLIKYRKMTNMTMTMITMVTMMKKHTDDND